MIASKIATLCHQLFSFWRQCGFYSAVSSSSLHTISKCQNKLKCSTMYKKLLLKFIGNFFILVRKTIMVNSASNIKQHLVSVSLKEGLLYAGPAMVFSTCDMKNKTEEKESERVYFLKIGGLKYGKIQILFYPMPLIYYKSNVLIYCLYSFFCEVRMPYHVLESLTH